MRDTEGYGMKGRILGENGIILKQLVQSIGEYGTTTLRADIKTVKLKRCLETETVTERDREKRRVIHCD